MHARTSALLAVLAAVALLAAPGAGLAQKGKSKSKKNPTVELATSMGSIRIELYPDKAPKTVENFLGYVKSGHYNGTIFHRVIADFMIQGGGFDGAYQQKATRAPITNEADNGLKNDRSTIAMARTGDPNSATAQFFINVKDNDMLNHRSKDQRGWGYCVFGKVVQGMDVVDKIRAVPTGPGGPFPTDAPQKQVVIKKARQL
jgi:peptidyl-prolyl cis-trans isomerase B (cyclophilin B)